MAKTFAYYLIGGVLVNWQNSWLIEDISKKFQIPYPKLKEEFENNLTDYSSGKIKRWNSDTVLEKM